MPLDARRTPDTLLANLESSTILFGEGHLPALGQHDRASPNLEDDIEAGTSAKESFNAPNLC
jgi:hypothetical protein